ncbi:MAG: helix-turn-helix transcriptional regulator [Clostridia bacterium]|nr:helix-turn-helix transcriptional regulator [Clostridia bacterium]
MIVFDPLWETLKRTGKSTYWLRETCGIDSKTIRRLKANENVETKTLDKLCTALDCDLSDVLFYRKDEA